ncbi:MAG: hypothetical protein KDA99_05595, partial [Planctomycetales bacterium]|nr:hypothetical protein [Planctomycetales bacterium]
SPWDRTAAGPQGNPAVPLASLSRDSMELFTTRVQPLLVNRCGASNCHGGTNNMSFRLIDGRWGNRVPRRITQQNLLAMLAQIDAQDPAHSPLLQPHAHLASAGVEEIAFDGTTRGQYELLTRWIEMSLEKPLHHAPAPPQLRQVPTVGTRPNNATPNSATRSPGIEPTRGGETDPFDPAEFERNER